MEQGFCQPPTRQLWIMRSVQNSFLKKFLPHLIKEPREASKSVRCERVPEPRTGHDLSHAGTGHDLSHDVPNLLIKAFVPEHSVAVWSSSRMNSTSTKSRMSGAAASVLSRGGRPPSLTSPGKEPFGLATSETNPMPLRSKP